MKDSFRSSASTAEQLGRGSSPAAAKPNLRESLVILACSLIFGLLFSFVSFGPCQMVSFPDWYGGDQGELVP